MAIWTDIPPHFARGIDNFEEGVVRDRDEEGFVLPLRLAENGSQPGLGETQGP